MSTAIATWISGPVLRARPDGAFRLREAVRVGEQGLLGEVIRIARDCITVQIYEDTSGLRPGILVEGSGRLLSIRVGPGILARIFDGLLRPIGDPADPFVSPGMQPHEPRSFRFKPGVQVGNRLTPGAAIGEIDNGTGLAQRCLVSPDLPTGEVAEIAEAGLYRDDEPVCRLRATDGTLHPIAMSHDWPVRLPRPVAERLASDEPMLTGQRIIDCLFPVARGGTGAIPGGFGTGKTVLLETVAKWCNADVIVYVGCGERGNEMAGLLAEFTELEDPRSGRPLMERTVVIANTSNMPVSAREASIYTGITVAEYFRDQGLDVTLMADSTSRWAEALREVSGRLGELPGEAGYPAYLSSRLAAFYERAARVRTLCGSPGSVTVLGAVSPPSGDFSEPVTTHTKRYVGCLWGLDTRRAQARFYPAIHPLQSYSVVAGNLSSLVAPGGLHPLGGAAPPLPHPAGRRGPAGAHGPHRRAGCHARPPAPDPAVRPVGQSVFSAPVRILRERPFRLARTPVRDDAAHRQLHRRRRAAAGVRHPARGHRGGARLPRTDAHGRGDPRGRLGRLLRPGPGARCDPEPPQRCAKEIDGSMSCLEMRSCTPD